MSSDRVASRSPVVRQLRRSKGVRFPPSRFSTADRVAGGTVPRVWTIAIPATLRSGDIVGFCVGPDETLRRINALYSEAQIPCSIDTLV